MQDFPSAVYLVQTTAARIMPEKYSVAWVADSRGKTVRARQTVPDHPDIDAYLSAASGRRAFEAINMFIKVKRWVNRSLINRLLGTSAMKPSRPHNSQNVLSCPYLDR